MSMRPMLASNATEIQFPVYASPKIDGVRALIFEGNLVSRRLKKIPNKFIQNYFKSLPNLVLEGLDGELVVGEPNHPNVMQNTTSGVMSREGEPDFTYYVFDYWHAWNEPFSRRDTVLALFFDSMEKTIPGLRIKHLQQVQLHTQAELDNYEAGCLAQGYEGVMVRKPDAPYKYGRSTVKEGYLLKVKRFSDAEAEIIDVEELMHNANEATTNALGLTERSTHKANKVGMGVLGSLRVRMLDDSGVEFNIGTGFTAEQRREFWTIKDELIGQLAKFRYFAGGVKEAPRFPVWVGFRDPLDL